jgi:hypothetical protein
METPIDDLKVETSNWLHGTDDGGSKCLWNVGKLLPDYTAQ